MSMKVFALKKSFFALLAAVCLGWMPAAGQSDSAKSGPAAGSVRPMLQDIKVQRDTTADSAPQLVKKTGSSTARTDIANASAAAANAIKTSFPILAETAIPGYSGVLVETLDGTVVVDSASDVPFNPASNVKIATTYAVLKTLGPNYRFQTSVWTDGSYEETTGTIHGNLYVSGRDPVFGYEHAIALASELNRMGIRSIEGDLVVTDNFTMNYSSSPQSSSKVLFTSMDAAKRSAAAKRVWENYLINSGKLNKTAADPGIAFAGGVYVQPMPSNAKLLFTHESAPLRDIVKAMMCYSNNFVAERLGDLLGGPYAVARIVQQNIGALPSEFSIQTTSGLGINRVTPSAMMKLLRTLRGDLAKYRMTFADIMPVAGMDKGTLENRFDTDFSTGSVIGKTGTLGNTDGGVSALAGEINTRNGTLLFVIFNQRGSVARFRSFQNNYVSLIQGQLGGPAPIAYTPKSLDARLAQTKFSYPSQGSLGNE
ncbi:MAG TPA: D-alanyl-D-alanine carboxypeptidase [Pyrinomonadaceae bacterium]|nr:D-alanyl-D-alanine carboxypeptidase [Pyrinomonadaceae bacterium]